MSYHKKICIVVTSLGKGGAERSSVLLSKMLFNQGHQVHLVTIVDVVEYEFKGELLNLGDIEKGNSIVSKIRKFSVFKSYLKEHNFDFVIDNRSRPSFLREIIVSRFLYNPKNTIYCVRSYNLDIYFIKSKLIAKLIYKDAFKIVTVSKEIENKVINYFGFNNVETIYNPIDQVVLNDTDKSKITDYVLFYGRLVDEVKNISLLIESYQKSQLPSKGIDLVILGNGQDLEKFKEKIKQLNLVNEVHFIPFTANPFDYVKLAKFTLLTSHYEGFPRSLLESLALGTPVISVDCKSGPNEIIIHEHNGLLVENYNSEALAKAMNRLINDTNLYKTCKANAKKSVEPFSMASISNLWKKLLN